MNITIAKRDLLRLVARCQGVADRKSSLPALANVLLTASGQTLNVYATDLYLSVSGTSPAEVKIPGSVGIPAKDLYERVKAMPDGPVHVTQTSPGSVVLKAGSTSRRYTMRSMPGEDFPEVARPDAGAKELELPASLLALLIGRTHFAISTDETRAALNSALFEWDGDQVRMVATDGHRLCFQSATVVGSAHATMLLSMKGVGELRRLLDEAKGEVGKDSVPTMRIVQSGPYAFFTIRDDGSSISSPERVGVRSDTRNFGVADIRLSIKLIDATFPPYQRILPERSEHSVKVGRAAFADALRAVSIASSDRTGVVKLTAGDGKLVIESSNAKGGDGADELAVEYSGPTVTIRFNARYLLDVCGALECEEVLFGCGGDLDPAVMRPAEDVDGQRYTAIVMPMRI